MAYINYENLPSTNTPLNATNLNSMQVEESGNNSNGYYIKYNDGTLIQWNTTTVTDQAINSHYGDSVLYTGTRTVIFPISFIDTNYSAFCGEFHWGTSASWGVVYNKNSTNWMTLMIYDFYTRNSGTNTLVSWTAIGKWK